MGLLIAKTDFTGKYSIAQNSFTKLDDYIAKYEKNVLRKLLGITLFNLFEADVVSMVPTTPIYQSLYNPFQQDNNNLIVISEGMKSMLLGFVWYEYIRDEKFKNTIVGTVVGANENARESGFSEAYVYGRYNDSICTYNAIQWFILKNKTDYESYNGQQLSLSHWAL